MNKDELLKLKKELFEAKKDLYYATRFSELDERGLVVDAIDEISKADILSEYAATGEQALIDYLENSFETIIRGYAESGEDLKEIEVSMGMYCFIPKDMQEKIVKGKYDYYLPKKAFNKDKIINDLQSVYVWFNSNIENIPADDFLDQKTLYKNFIVNYNKLVSMLKVRGFELSFKTNEELLNEQLNGKMAKIVIDFQKEKKNNK